MNTRIKVQKNNLLGTHPPPELVELLSNELQVTPNTPPCFIWTTYEDKTVPMENTCCLPRHCGKTMCPLICTFTKKAGTAWG